MTQRCIQIKLFIVATVFRSLKTLFSDRINIKFCMFNTIYFLTKWNFVRISNSILHAKGFCHKRRNHKPEG